MPVQTACINTVGQFNSDQDLVVGANEVVNSTLHEALVTFEEEENDDARKHVVCVTRRTRKLQSQTNDKKESLTRYKQYDDEIMVANGPAQYRQYDEDIMTAFEQNIVPAELLVRFLSMTEYYNLPDVEISRYCAFSLPAVAYTLGRKYWPCLRRMCTVLAKSMQWKVRRTIAASLHDLALIIGKDLTAKDLLPLFLLLLKDLDEVRLGAIIHLPAFLKHLHPCQRKEFLPLAEELLKLDNERNWRFRYALAEQLSPTAELFNPSDVQEYFLPIALWLIEDKVSEVRKVAIMLVAVVIKRLSEEDNMPQSRYLLTEFDDRFRQADKWLSRQIYVLLCQQLASSKSLPTDVFVKEVVPNLFSLVWDKVANVRLAVSRCLAQTFLPLGYLPSIQRTHYQLYLQVMYSLQNDSDRDVRYFAHFSAEVFNVLPPKKLSPV